jgi:hypothetical protein
VYCRRIIPISVAEVEVLIERGGTKINSMQRTPKSTAEAAEIAELRREVWVAFARLIVARICQSSLKVAWQIRKFSDAPQSIALVSSAMLAIKFSPGHEEFLAFPSCPWFLFVFLGG